MVYVGSFSSKVYVGRVYGTAIFLSKGDGFEGKLTYCGTYKNGQTVDLELARNGNTFFSEKNGQTFELTVPENFNSIPKGEKIIGQFRSKNPDDNGEIIFYLS